MSPFLEHNGVRLVHAADGVARVEVKLDPQHRNSWGVAHGGLIMTLLDVALAQAARSLDARARAAVTVDLKVSFLQPGSDGPLCAEGRCRHRSTTLSFCEGEVRDAQGRLVAQALGTFKVLRGQTAKR